MNIAATASFSPAFNPVQAIPVPWREMVSHRGALVRFAKARLHDPMLAEDVVHDVFEAVLSGRAAFAGRAALRSWLTAILKHKIVDLVRQRGYHASLDQGDENEEDSQAALAVACPQPGPEQRAEQRELLTHALARIEKLPSGLRDAVRLRLIEEESTDAVCKALSISEENLFVRLHRARKQLLC